MNKVTVELSEMGYSMREEIKTLRTNLLFTGEDKKVILFTSTMAGEGKSELAMRTAKALAEIDKNVLLLDLDLRKSVMASRYGMKQVKEGMSHFLSGQSKLSDVICATDIPKLHVALAGPSVLNPTELFSSERFGKMIETLRDIYDYIIVDSAPVGMLIDAAIIAQECDGAVLVVEVGRTKYRAVQEAKSRIENSSCPILGVVLNKVNLKKNRYYNGKYGKYGQYYGY